MSAAQVADVLFGAALGIHGSWQATCPICGDTKGTQIVESDDHVVVDTCCKHENKPPCPPEEVRDRILALYNERHGEDLPDPLLTPKEHRKRPKTKAKAEAPPHTNGSTNGKSRARFAFQRWDEITYAPDSSQWLVDKLLPTEGFGVIYGKWKQFKSFVALDLGVAISRGSDWAGRKTKRGIVIYLACEGGQGLTKRIEGYKRKHGIADADFFLGNVRLNLGSSPGDLLELAAAVRALVGDKAPVLVVIDTLARTLGDKDENTDGMRNFVNNADDLSAAFKCLVLAVHHEGAGETGRMRGGTTADAGSVATWRVSRPHKTDLRCIVEVQEAKDEESNFSMVAQLERYEFDGTGESTLIVSSVEISPDGQAGETAARDTPRIPKNQAAFMTAVTQALEKHGKRKRPFADGPVVYCVTRESARQRFDIIRADLKDEDSRKRIFNNQLAAAVAREDLVTRLIDGETLLWSPQK